MSTITCPNCRAQVPAGAVFCDNCGVKLAAAPELSVAAGICPNCHAAVRPDDRFCDSCGYALFTAAENPQLSVQPAEALNATPDDLSNPRLLIQPTGNILALPRDQDVFVIGRQDPASGSYPDVDLVPYGGEEGGVSRRHAQITHNGGQYFIEDLNSVNYTFVNKQKIAVGAAHPLRDGDEIRLGRVLMRFKGA